MRRSDRRAALGAELPGESMLRELVVRSHLMSMEQLPDAVAGTAANADLDQALIYIADIQQTVLRLLIGKSEQARRDRGAEAAELTIKGTMAGRAFQTVQPAKGQVFDDGSFHYWAPILDGTERIGVLRVTLRQDDDRARQDAEYLAGLIALLIVSKSPYSETYSRLRRTRDMTVSAEMQWRLMPPLTFANDQVVIGAALEPAYEMGGDAFDYALTGDIVHFGVFDAMGHDIASGIASSLAVSAVRNGRLRGISLQEIGRWVEEILLRQDVGERFVTAVMADLDLQTGMLSWVLHGHPPPVVIRGGRWVNTLECRPAHPLGTGLGISTTLCHEQLEPGDRVLLYTDGIVEARDPDGEEFGLARFADFIIRRDADGMAAPETLRRLVNSILEHHAGRLDDDATVLLLEWLGPSAPEDAMAAIRQSRRT